MTHRGQVEAEGLWFPPGTRGLPERLLSAWEPGSRLLDTELGPVLLFAAPRRIEASRAPGAPLVRGSSTVEPAPEGALRLCWHGVGRELRLGELRPFAPPLEIEVVEGEPLARPVEAPDERVSWPTLSLRQQLRGVPPPAPALQQVTLGAEAREPWWRRLLPSWWSNQASYLRKLVRMLEEGDWEQALRHGIPLGGGDHPLARFLGSLRPRKDLTIGSRRTPGGAVVLNGEGYLRMLYRRAFEHLDRAGQIDQAAFVLAELLGEHQQAVLYLEKHKRYLVAARLAEARELDPSLRIRLWFQAEQVDMALVLAARHEAYGQAYLGLLSLDRERAAAWQWEWARHLAATGRFAQALELVWTTGLEARREWLQPAVEQGGVSGGRSLARWLQEPRGEEVDRLVWLSQEWLRELDPVTESRVKGLALGLMEGAATEPARFVAGQTARALLAWGDGGGWCPDRRQMESLLRAAGDPWLKVDRPARPTRPPRRAGAWVEVLDDGGALEPRDALVLPDGRTLVAMGESGVAVFSARGKMAGVAPMPAEALVEGSPVVLLAFRGDLCSLARLDPVTGRARPWCTVRGLSWWAPSQTGSVWLVVQDQTLYAIDVSSDSWRTLWKVPLSEPVAGGSLGPRALGLLLQTQVELYSLPDLQLRRRLPVPNEPYLGVGPEGVLRLEASAARLGLHGATLEVAAENARLVWHGAWTVAVVREAAGMRAWAVHRAGELPPVELRFPGARRLIARGADEHLLLADDLGRLALADLYQGWLVRSFRLSLGR